MSSFIGHGLAGLTVALNQRKPKLWKNNWWQWLGIVWCIFLAEWPDVDYVVPFLHPKSNGGLRVTHSLFVISILPSLTVIGLRLLKCDRKLIFHVGSMSALAILSHILLDLGVGVTALPLLWPISSHVFKLPFGVLPSAGKISFSNPYFYSNLGIEMGVLIPFSFLLYLARSTNKTQFQWILGFISISTAIYFIAIAYALPR